MINTTVIKLAVWLLVIKEIWLLLQIPSIANAVISFCTIGAIPGSDETLSPESTLVVLGVTFVVAALLIFRKEFMSLAHKMFARPAKPVIPAMPLAPLRAKAAPVVPNTPKAVKAPRVSITPIIARLRLLVRPQLHRAKTATYRTAQKTKQAGIWLFMTTKARLIPLVETAIDIAVLVGVIIADLSVRAWRTTRPHLERFDKYLEQKVHKNTYADAAIKAAGDALVVVKGWWSEIKDKETLPKLERK